MINFYIYKNINFSPFVIIVASVNSDEQVKEMEDNVDKIFKVLFTKSIIKLNNILLFNIYHNHREKRQFFVHKGSNSLKQFFFDNLNLENLIFNVIKDFNSDYELILNNQVFDFKNNSKNLNFLCDYW